MAAVLIKRKTREMKKKTAGFGQLYLLTVIWFRYEKNMSFMVSWTPGLAQSSVERRFSQLRTGTWDDNDSLFTIM
ncbi:hypothetical protein PoB_002248700 [Plakobranchus ocellatus]|uniref:Uncharacterized protein n=1 Tax=Plakobranchus ocellatus TaxID=259542 RepID=A0AAV3ZMT8_9GAST|nr:hypothetical protein PoB_002248700 [Plakobranchus ocellatus]